MIYKNIKAVLVHIVLSFACFTASFGQGSPNALLLDTPTIDVTRHESLIPYVQRENTFSGHAVMFLEGVRLDTRWSQEEKNALKATIAEMREIYRKTPTAGKLSPSQLERRKELMKGLGQAKGAQEFFQEYRLALESNEAFFNRTKQQACVWEAFNALESHIGEFHKIKRAFLIYIIMQTGPTGFVNDVEVVSLMGLEGDDVEAIRNASSRVVNSYQSSLDEMKCAAFETVWDILDENQQRKFCRLLGRTERVVLLSPINQPVDGLKQALTARARIGNFCLADASDEILLCPEFQTLYRQCKTGGITRRKIDDVSLKKLVPVVLKATNGIRGSFESDKHHIAWLESRRSIFKTIIDELDSDERQVAKELTTKLEILVEKLSDFGSSLPVLDDLVPSNPMIYYLHEHDKLDDTFERSRFLETVGNASIVSDNYIPFIVSNPYEGRAVPPEESLIVQYQSAHNLAAQWSRARLETVDFSNRVAVNNRFLRETKKIMLPFQYSETFRSFYKQAGLVVLFHYHDVARDFEISKAQQEELRSAGTIAADKLEKGFHNLRSGMLQDVFSVLESRSSSSLEKTLGIDKKALCELLEQVVSESRFPLMFEQKEFILEMKTRENPLGSGWNL